MQHMPARCNTCPQAACAKHSKHHIALSTQTSGWCDHHPFRRVEDRKSLEPPKKRFRMQHDVTRFPSHSRPYGILMVAWISCRGLAVLVFYFVGQLNSFDGFLCHKDFNNVNLHCSLVDFQWCLLKHYHFDTRFAGFFNTGTSSIMREAKNKLIVFGLIWPPCSQQRLEFVQKCTWTELWKRLTLGPLMQQLQNCPRDFGAAIQLFGSMPSYR